MNKNFIYGLVVGLGVLALFGFKSVVERPAGAGVTKWEYMSIVYKPALSAKKYTFYVTGPNGLAVERELVVEENQIPEMLLLNEFGKQGWELVTRNNPFSSGTASPVTLQQPTILKRPVVE